MKMGFNIDNNKTVLDIVYVNYLCYIGTYDR